MYYAIYSTLLTKNSVNKLYNKCYFIYRLSEEFNCIKMYLI